MLAQVDQVTQIEESILEAVPKVFQSMVSMDLTIEPAAILVDDPRGEIIGSVGFTGKATGVVYLYAGMSFARKVTCSMLGLTESDLDEGDMVSDALGELSNMVTGHVKTRLCDAGWTCTLTIPSVVRGQQLSVKGASHSMSKMFGFRCGEDFFLAQLLLKEPQA